MTDPIADMLTRVRNALAKRHEVVEVPNSKLKEAITQILKSEGYIRDFHLADYKNQGMIRIHLKYHDKKPAIEGLRRVSRPGRRIYLKHDNIKPVYHGTGVAVLSTPKGILTDSKARELKVGGELLLNVW